MSTKFLTVAQFAELIEVSPQRVRAWLATGRIRGAIKPGRDWLIPATAKKPKDGTSGRPKKIPE